MSWRIGTLILHDARLQWRYGIYGAYAVVVALYAVIIASAGEHLPDWVVATIIFTDPAALGFFFLGALMMLERSEGVRAAQSVTPMAATDYLAAKAVTLTVMALCACAVLLAFVHGAANPVLLLVTVALTSVQYVGIGVPIALRFKTVSGYLVGSSGFLTPVIAPAFLGLLEPLPAWLIVVPAVSQYRLILVATGAATATPAELTGMLAISCLAAAGAIWLAIGALRGEFGR